MSNRQRGRRVAPPPLRQSLAEQEIKRLQAKLVAHLEGVEDTRNELAHACSKWIAEGAGTAEIASWMVSPDKPNGLSRQQVYKLISERVDKKPKQPSRKPINNTAVVIPKRARPVRPKRTQHE